MKKELASRGIATEAARALVTWLTEHSVRTVIAHVHPRHQASSAVAAAAGLTPTTQWHDGEIRWRRAISLSGKLRDKRSLSRTNRT